MVCDVSGRPIDDLVVSGANQEHGIISSRSRGTIELAKYPVGTRLRVLPNHACSTAAQYDAYDVLSSDGGVHARWPRFNGW
jgi:D-serine deaminase-like pyridoxal phosphate-dependent protein